MLFNKKALLCATALPLLTLAASANAKPSIEIGAAAWHTSPSGWVEDSKSKITAHTDIENNLHLGSKTTGFFWARFKHSVPLLPNVELRYTRLDMSGSGTSDFTFRDKKFTGDISSQVKLNQMDAILFYTPWDKTVSVDVGLDIKYIDGKFAARSATKSASVDFKAPIPMLYGRLGVNVPNTDLRFDLRASAIGYSGSRISDVYATARYTFFNTVDIEAGYRAFELKVDDIKDVSGDVKFKGPYLGVSVHF